MSNNNNSYNRISTNIDLDLLKIKSADEQLRNIKRNENKLSALLEEAVKHNSLKVNHALKILNQQWKINGVRERTISSYNYTFDKFVEFTDVEYLHEIDSDKIYAYLGSFENVKDITIQTRLKQLKAILNRCHDNGWIQTKFWNHIKVRVNTELKEAADEKEIELLLSLLDKTRYSGFRDSIAIMLMYSTGIRIKTLGLLEEKHIDFKNKMLVMDGAILKSHRAQLLPLTDELCILLQELINQNNIVRKRYKKKNNYIFLSNLGTPVCKTVSTANTISKNLWVYNKQWGLNVTAHGLRRRYAQNLLKRGADINLVSAALNHNDLTSTTKYLGLSIENVAQNLRDYL